MNKYMAEKMVEQLLMNGIMYKDVEYQITEQVNDIKKRMYTVHKLQASIENGVIWFGHDDIPDILISSIVDILFLNDIIEISLLENYKITITLL